MDKKEFEKQPTETDKAFARALTKVLDDFQTQVPLINQTAVMLNAVGWQIQQLNAEAGCDPNDLMKMIEFNMNAGGDAYRAAHGIKGSKVN